MSKLSDKRCIKYTSNPFGKWFFAVEKVPGYHISFSVERYTYWSLYQLSIGEAKGVIGAMVDRIVHRRFDLRCCIM